MIEDAPDVLDVLTMLLRDRGRRDRRSRERHEALKVFRSRHFDVVVTDLGLPDISGRCADPHPHRVVTYLDGLALVPAAA